MFDFMNLENFPLLGGLSELLGLQVRVVAMSMMCAVIGALIMSRFTIALGSITYVLNYLLLLAGALLANLLVSHFSNELDISLERTLFVSIAGMLVASLLSLPFLARGTLSD